MNDKNIAAQNKIFMVTPDDIGMRLDRFLGAKDLGFTQGMIQKNLRTKLIRVNGKKAEANYRIQENDEISVKLLSDFVPTERPKKILSTEKISEFKSQIIFEDENIIAINKKSGQAVQGGLKIKNSLDEIALAYTNSTEARLVHRLDQDTSGVLIIAKNRKTASDLAASFKGKDVKKTYLALCSYVPKEPVGRITYSIIHDDKEQKAETRYKLLSAFAKDASLIEFTPITGRKHQIRIHAKDIGCPVVNDRKYNPEEKPSFVNTDNLMLHCLEISLKCNGKIYDFRANPPKYFGDVY